MLFKPETSEKNKENGKKYNFNKNILNNFSIPKINFGQFTNQIEKQYKDPYDYFFSQSYLVYFFIFAAICLVLFDL